MVLLKSNWTNNQNYLHTPALMWYAGLSDIGNSHNTTTNKMLKRLVKLIPSKLLNTLYGIIFGELVRRGNIKFPDEASCIETSYGDYLIKLRTEQDQSYTTTWSVHKGELLVCEGEDEFHSSVGEAESSAIKWIESFQEVTEYLKQQATGN